MRILNHAIHYSPELTGIGNYTGEMAGRLVAQGHGGIIDLAKNEAVTCLSFIQMVRASLLRERLA